MTGASSCSNSPDDKRSCVNNLCSKYCTYVIWQSCICCFGVLYVIFEGQKFHGLHGLFLLPCKFFHVDCVEQCYLFWWFGMSPMKHFCVCQWGNTIAKVLSLESFVLYGTLIQDNLHEHKATSFHCSCLKVKVPALLSILHEYKDFKTLIWSISYT